MQHLQCVAEPEWPNGIQCYARRIDGHGYEPRTSTNACGHIFKYMAQLPCWSLYSQQVSHQRWIWGSRRQESTQTRDPPGLWNPGQTSPEVQNRGISDPTKKTYVLQNLFKKISNVYMSVNIRFQFSRYHQLCRHINFMICNY